MADHPVDVVGIVASAGGVEALSHVLRCLPGDFPAPVIVAQHLGGHGSELARVLGRRSPLPVVWAEDGTKIEPGRVIVCPPRSLLEILPDSTCTLRPATSLVEERPFDTLLSSLADSFGSGAVGVVLTGMGKDGAAGVAALKAAGGTVIAQDAQTADHPSMPQAAAAAGADLVVPLPAIASVLTAVLAGEPLAGQADEPAAIAAVFGDGGELAALARRVDWSSHPLGPVDRWPAELRTVLRLAMDYPTPFSVLWGEQLIHFYNDASLGTQGDNHPRVFAIPVVEAYPESWEALEPLYRRVQAGETVHMPTMPVPLVRAGQLHDTWFDFVYAPIRGADGRVGGVSCVWTETTAEVLGARRLQTVNGLAAAPVADGRRKALESALEILATAPDIPFAAAYLLEPRGRVAGLVGAFGIGEGDAMAPRQIRLQPGPGWPLHEVVTSAEPALVEDLAERFRGCSIGPDAIAPGSAVVHPLRDEAEEAVVGILVLGVTPRLPLDQRFREFLAVVGETVSSKVAEAHARRRERDRLRRLAELDRAKTEFFSGVSHEFRTPLTLMLGPVEEMLRQDGLAAAQRQDLELIRRNARRLLRLVASLLDFSQIEAGRLQAQFCGTDLAAWTREIVAQFESAVASAGLELVVAVEPLDEPVWVDPEMWEKIVCNLVSNALKYTFEGTIEVRLRALPQHAELVVRDTGVGIAQEELPFVFKRFHRVDAARARTYEGAGIGLALVEELVRRHQGRVRVTSTVGEGSSFTVWIPLGRRSPTGRSPRPRSGEPLALAAAMAEEAADWDGQRLAVTTPSPGGGAAPESFAPGAHVLVADDNADMRAYLQRLLAAHWRVTTAGDGAEALALAQRDPPDLVVADVMMPGTGGFGLLAAIRADDRLQSVPVILVTARAEEESAIEALLAGADDYIVKPFGARELVARAGAHLEPAALRARVTAERTRQESRVRQVLETDAVGVLFFDPDGTITDANDVFCHMSGYSRDDLNRRQLTWRDLTPPEFVAVSEEQMQRLDATGRIGPYEKDYFMRDGTRRRMLFVGRTLDDGTIAEYCVDITGLKPGSPSAS